MEKIQKWVTSFSIINGVYILGNILLFVSMINVQAIIGSVVQLIDAYFGIQDMRINTCIAYFYFSSVWP
jgi:hypothetical protein